MKKKILALSILAVFMLVTVSLGTVGGSESTRSTESKESPLYKIRNNKKVNERIGNILENIKTKFLGERTFFLPFTSLTNREPLSLSYLLQMKSGITYSAETCAVHHTCVFPIGLCNN